MRISSPGWAASRAPARVGYTSSPALATAGSTTLRPGLAATGPTGGGAVSSGGKGASYTGPQAQASTPSGLVDSFWRSGARLGLTRNACAGLTALKSAAAHGLTDA